MPEADTSQLGLFLHGTQAVANALVALLLLRFHRVYRRPFLLYWGLAWAALTLFHLGAASGAELVRLAPGDPLRLTVGALTLAAGYAQATWLLAGTWSLGARRPVSRAARAWLVALPLALGSASVLGSLSLASETRALVRLGLPGLVFGLAYLLAAVALARVARREPSAARWPVAGLFALLAATELGRFLSQLSLLEESFLEPLSTLVVPHFVAFFLQLLLLSGLLLWFFEEERADLLRTARALAESEERRLRAEHMEAVGRLAGGVAHDFNNLLTAITGHAELLLARLDGGHRDREDLLPITRAAGRAAGLVRELLTFSRRQTLLPRHFVLDELLGDMRKMLAPLLGADVRLGLELGAPGAVVFADPGQIELCLLNLAGNARDALSGPGELVLSTAVVEVAHGADALLAPGHYVRLDVRDTGCGIRADQLPRIFEPFFTTKPGKGTGLGLASVHGIVKQSGGEIRVESTPGRGTTFHLWLPLAAAPAAAEPRDELVPLAFGRGGSETLLVVEDDPDVRLTTQRQLARAGYRVLTAEDVDGALLLLGARAERFELVLCDVVLPGRSPAELLRELERQHPRCALVLMSAHSEGAVRQRGLGPARFLAKPFSAAVLLEVVRTSLDERRALRVGSAVPRAAP